MAEIISGKSRFKAQNISPEDEYAAAENEFLSEDDEYKKKIRSHRIKIGVIIGVIIAVLIIVALVIYNGMDNVKYTGYTIVKSVNKDDITTANYMDFGDGYIRYSNDGISYFNRKGSAIWNQTYEMKNPQVKMCGQRVAVGDINGSVIYTFDEKGMTGNIDTSLSIAQIEVGSQGVVAAVLEDTSANYINLYSLDGNKIYTVKTTLAGDGYPLDISISDDATKLMASFVYVSGEAIKTNVVFYNFSEVGQNETERLVGGFNHYDSTIVPDVDFITDTSAVAIGENIISFYKINEYPSLAKEITLENEVERVFTSDKYVGVVLKNGSSEEIYRLVVYSTTGSKVCETSFNTEYSTIKFDDRSVVMYNDSTFTLLNMKGSEMTTQSFDLPIEAMLSLNTRGEYIFISTKYIQDCLLYTSEAETVSAI